MPCLRGCEQGKVTEQREKRHWDSAANEQGEHEQGRLECAGDSAGSTTELLLEKSSQRVGKKKKEKEDSHSQLEERNRVVPPLAAPWTIAVGLVRARVVRRLGEWSRSLAAVKRSLAWQWRRCEAFGGVCRDERSLVARDPGNRFSMDGCARKKIHKYKKKKEHTKL